MEATKRFSGRRVRSDAQTTTGSAGPDGCFLLLVLPLDAFITVALAQYENGSLLGPFVTQAAPRFPTSPSPSLTMRPELPRRSRPVTPATMRSRRCGSGVYTISASAPALPVPKQSRSPSPSAARERIDLTLKVGADQATTVEVSDVALQPDTETSERDANGLRISNRSVPLVSRNYIRLLAMVTGSRQAPTAATTSSISSLVRAGAYNVNGQRSMFNNFPARRHGQQRVWREQPGFRQPDHRHPARLCCAVQRGHEQRERGVRAFFRRRPSMWHLRAAAIASTRCSMTSFATPI